jgi:hypothetical protein
LIIEILLAGGDEWRWATSGTQIWIGRRLSATREN